MNAFRKAEAPGDLPDAVEIGLWWQPTYDHELGSREKGHRLHQQIDSFPRVELADVVDAKAFSRRAFSSWRRCFGYSGAIRNDVSLGERPVLLDETIEKAARDRDHGRGFVAHAMLATRQSSELRGRRRRRAGSIVEARRLLGEDGRDRVRFVEDRQTMKPLAPESGIGENEIARIDRIVPTVTHEWEALDGEDEVSPRASGCRDGQSPQTQIRMRSETEKLEARGIGSGVAPPHHELHEDAVTGECMTGLDRLDSVGPLHGEADVGEVEESH
jgi:hypothetical protein